MKKLKLRFLSLMFVTSLALAASYNAYQKTSFNAAGTAAIQRQSTLIHYHQLAWTVTGSPASCSVAIDSSPDGTTWTSGGIMTGQTCTSNGQSVVVNTQANYVRVNLTALSGGATALIVYTGWVNNPAGGGGGGLSGTGTDNFLAKWASGNLAGSLYSDTGTNGSYQGSSFGVGTSPSVSCNGLTNCIAGKVSSAACTSIAGEWCITQDPLQPSLLSISLNGSSRFYIPVITAPGSTGQVPIVNNDGSQTPGDPLVSFAPVPLSQNQDASNTFTTNVQRIPTLGTSGTLIATIANFVSGGTGCTVNMFWGDSLGNFSNVGNAVVSISVAAAGTSAYNVPLNSSTPIGTATFVRATYACSGGYPTAGTTITLEYAPRLSTSSSLDLIGGNKISIPYPGSLGAVMTGLGTNGATASSGYASLCDQTTFGTLNSSTVNNQIAAAVGAKRTHICSFTLLSNSTTATVVKLVQGTQATNPCDTGTADASLGIPIQAPASQGPVGVTINPFLVNWQATTSAQLCISESVASPVNYQVFWTNY